MKRLDAKVRDELTPTKLGVKEINTRIKLQGSKEYIVPGEKMVCIGHIKGTYYSGWFVNKRVFDRYNGNINELMNCRHKVVLFSTAFAEYQFRGYLKPFAAIVAFADWLGQQNETLKQCYVKRLKIWGVK